MFDYFREPIDDTALIRDVDWYFKIAEFQMAVGVYQSGKDCSMAEIPLRKRFESLGKLIPNEINDTVDDDNPAVWNRRRVDG